LSCSIPFYDLDDATRDRVWADDFPGDVEVQVKTGEEDRPTGLAAIEFLSRHEIFQVFMISEDLDRMSSAFEIVTPLF